MLCLIRFAKQQLLGDRIFTKILAVLIDPCLGNEVDDAAVPIDTAQINIPVGCDCLIVAILQLHHGDIKRSATEVVHQDTFLLLAFSIGREKALLDAKTDCCGSGLVDDVQHLQSRQSTGVLCRLSTRFVEERGDGNDRLFNRAEFQFGILFQLAQHQSLQHLRRKRRATNRFAKRLLPDIAFCKQRQTLRLVDTRFHRLGPNHRRAAIEEDGARCGESALGIADRFGPPGWVDKRDG